jgi:hypothetical protein
VHNHPGLLILPGPIMSVASINLSMASNRHHEHGTTGLHPVAGHSGLLRQHQRRLPLHQPRQHQRTKHVEIDLHFVRERVAVRDVRVLHDPMISQFADIFTKGLPSSVFSEEFRFSLNICSG